MNKRALTVEEIKALVVELAGKVTAEGQELYNELKTKVEKLSEDASEDVDAIKSQIRDIQIELEMLLDKVSVEGQAIIERIEDRIDEVYTEIQEEIAEIKEEGIVSWAKTNKDKLALAGAAIVIVGIIVGIILL
jgi:gas vesicle protein